MCVKLLSTTFWLVSLTNRLEKQRIRYLADLWKAIGQKTITGTHGNIRSGHILEITGVFFVNNIPIRMSQTILSGLSYVTVPEIKPENLQIYFFSSSYYPLPIQEKSSVIQSASYTKDHYNAHMFINESLISDHCSVHQCEKCSPGASQIWSELQLLICLNIAPSSPRICYVKKQIWSRVFSYCTL